MVSVTKKDAKRFLADVFEDKRFFCREGCIDQNFMELAGCLDRMSAETFAHHVNASKNDFSNWVRDVFGDDDLAASLWQATGSGEAAGVVRERVTLLENKLKEKTRRTKVKAKRKPKARAS